MVQLWINLPARHKNAEASYQALLNRDIRIVASPNGSGTLQVIAGEQDPPCPALTAAEGIESNSTAH